MSMKKNNILVALVLLMIPALAGAQALKGSYFLDNSLNRHELNPAFAPRADYFQLFGIGNMGFGAMTNLDMPSLLYPKDGKLVTFLHPSVSMNEFNRSFPKNPHFDVDLRTTLFGFGFYTKNKAYWTFDIDVKTNLDVDLPGDLFRFVKAGTGLGTNSYNIGNINGYFTAGLQASLGYSRDFFKGFRAGMKARVIAPMGYAALNLENVRLTTSEDKWNIKTDAYVHAALKGLEVSLPEGELMPSYGFDTQKLLTSGVVAGFGYSFDFGAEYVLSVGSIFDGLAVSAAVTDLGLIHYHNDAVSSLESHGSLDWEGINIESIDNFDPEAFFNDFAEKAKEEFVNLSQMEHKGAFVRSTMPSFHVGVEMPFLKRSMSVGLLYSSRLSHSYARNELTVSYNLNPCKWFALGLNYSFLNTARTMGFIFELTPRVGPTFYIGCDYIPASFARLDAIPVVGMMPMAFRLNADFGIAFHVGGKNTRNPKKIKNKK